jgi:hypothetical protein
MDLSLIDFVEFIGIRNMMTLGRLIVLICQLGISSMLAMRLNKRIISFKIYKLIQNKKEHVFKELAICKAAGPRLQVRLA